MKRLALCIVLLFAAATMPYVFAQTSTPQPGAPVVTYPFNTGILGTNHSTLTLPLTGNLALAANANRRACIIQYKGTNTVNIATNASMTDALVLPAPATNNVSTFLCGQFGIVIGDPIYLSGTSADTVVLWWQ